MSVAVILVHYHTPVLLRRALDALRADAARSALEVEYCVVDNGSNFDGALPAAEPCMTVLRPPTNLGYGAGLNLGVTNTDADFLVFMNPDVLVRVGCLASLIEHLRAGAGASGPRLWLDDGRTILLPPLERHGACDEILRALATRSPRWAMRARRRWRRHAQRHWRATAPRRSYHLSGAMLAVSRAAWNAVGPFDERYRLYFEETDWLRRLRAAKVGAVFEPRAEAVHLYAQSTAGEGRAAAWFAASEELFRQQHVGAATRRLVSALAPPVATKPGPSTAPARAAGDNGENPFEISCRQATGERAAWVELSLGPSGFPAAAARLDNAADSWSLPRAVRARLRPGVYTLRTVSTAGNELAVSSFSIGAATG